MRPPALRLYRVALVAAIVWLVRDHQARIVRGDPIRIEEVRVFLPQAKTLDSDPSERGGVFVREGGYALRTSPVSDAIVGFCGTTDTLVVMGPDGRVVGMAVRRSGDTTVHVSDVKADEYFMKTFTGMEWDRVAELDLKKAGVEGVSGASLTSMAIARGVVHRFKDAGRRADDRPALELRWRDAGAALVVAAAAVVGFTRLRGRRWARRLFQAAVFVYLGAVTGDMLSVAMLAGWAASGVPLATAPGLALLAAAALAIPWATGTPLYCAQVCPHGAAQEWLGRLTRRKLHLSPALKRGLAWLGPALLALALAVTMLGVPLDLAEIEPFDAYFVTIAGAGTLGVAAAGLAASVWIPMAYCKYGCPTGALLAFVRSHGRADRFGARDVAAALMVLLAAGLWAFEAGWV